MKSEHDHEQKAKSWVGAFIASHIDLALLRQRSNGREIESGHCINLVDMIITPLVIGKEVSIETLEHLKIEFTPPRDKNEITGQINEDLRHIEEVLTAEFGNEVVKRLKLSIEEGRVRELLHN